MAFDIGYWSNDIKTYLDNNKIANYISSTIIVAG